MTAVELAPSALDEPIAPAKVVPPMSTGLHRPRLADNLDLGGEAGRLCVVRAPAGSGKTTAVASAVRLLDVPIGWVQADSVDDGDRLLRAIRQAMPALPARSIGSIEQLLADLDAASSSVLVIDDVHKIVDPDALEILQRLADLRPDGLSLVLIGRYMDLDLTQLLLSDRLTEVTDTDLRFRLWEVDALFREHYGVTLHWRDLAQLERTTGGWAAGLQLFHLATHRLPPDESRRLLHELGGRTRLHREYLTRQVLANVTSEQRDLLLRSCVLPSLSGDLCDELFQSGGNGARLRTIHDRGLFLTLDPDGQTFHCHDVLRSHLRDLGEEELGVATMQELDRRAGEILHRHGDVSGAVAAFARGGDWEQVRALLSGSGSLDTTATGWIDLVPKFARTDPWVDLAIARRSLRCGDLHRASAAYRRAEYGMRETGDAVRCRRERTRLERWMGRGDGDRSDWLGLVRHALATGHMPDDADLPASGSARHLALGCILLLRGDARGARSSVRRCFEVDTMSSVSTIIALVVDAVAAALCDDPDAATTLDRAEFASRRAEIPMATRLTLMGRLLLTDAGAPSIAHLRQACAEDNDEIGGHVATILEALGAFRRGVAIGNDELGSTASRLRTLGLGGIADWADALRAAIDPTIAPPEAAHFADAPLPRVLALTASAPPHTNGPESSRIIIRCLGTFELALDGEVVTLEDLRPKHREVLWFLAVSSPGWVHRDTIGAQLWPDANAEQLARRLQVAVSDIRRAIEPDAQRGAWTILERDGSRYRIAASADAVDLRVLDAFLDETDEHLRHDRALEAVQPLLEAARMLTNDIIPGGGSTDWLVSIRDRSCVAIIDRTRSIAGSLVRADNWAAAARLAEVAVRIDPFADDLWQLAIDANERTGNDVGAAQLRRRRQIELASVD